MKVDWKYQIKQYGTALVVAMPLFISLSWYIFYRRGYYDLYIANKVLAGVGAILLGIIFILGPLSRFFNIYDRFLQYRKEIGITAFVLILTHSLVSLFFLPAKFPMSRYLSGTNWPFILGLSGLVILIFLFLISNKKAEDTIGAKLWWWLQNWGLRLVVILTVLHVFVMKYAGWVNWYKVGGEAFLAHPELPGGGLLVGWVLLFSMLIRLAEFGGVKFGRLVWYFSLLTLPVVILITFWWGRRLVKNQEKPTCYTNQQVNAALGSKRCLVVYDNKVYDMTMAKKWDLTGHIKKHLCGKEYDKETIENGPHKVSVMDVFLVGEICLAK